MKREKTTYTVNRHGYHLLIDDVPAWVCSQCREVYFEEEEVNTIQNMLKGVDVSTEKIRKGLQKPVPA